MKPFTSRRYGKGLGRGGGGGVPPDKLVLVWGPFRKTLTLFMTKLNEFPYPIYDVFQTCVTISSLVRLFRPTLNYREHNL